MATMTAIRLFTLAEAAEELGTTYATVREYVTVRNLIAHYRRGGSPKAGIGGHGMQVFLDGSGLESLRQLLLEQGSIEAATAAAAPA